MNQLIHFLSELHAPMGNNDTIFVDIEILKEENLFIPMHYTHTHATPMHI
jgi:hypothetical protein